jgi:hypothetical protein
MIAVDRACETHRPHPGFGCFPAILRGFTYASVTRIVSGNNTRQGYALRSTLKPAGYFFPGAA